MEPREELFAVIQQGDAARVTELIDAESDLVNARDPDGNSALLIATYTGRREIFELLLQRGAGVNLFEASALGLRENVAAHVERDSALINTYSHDGWTPLHLAAFFGQRETVEMLLDRGADVNARSHNQKFGKENTPLHAAAANHHTKTAELLMNRGAEIDARDGSGFTPLALAAGTKNDILMILLLERGAQSS
ncbi:MAG: ankyrin repeat domain-containing protein [Acidobacteriota bacterium]|jgi:ankyrin repeat protein